MLKGVGMWVCSYFSCSMLFIASPASNKLDAGMFLCVRDDNSQQESATHTTKKGRDVDMLVLLV